MQAEFVMFVSYTACVLMRSTLSIIIPAYNEEFRLPSTLEKIMRFFETDNCTLALHEVLVIDDGSEDATVEVAQCWSDRLPVRAIRFASNRGKGAVVKDGMLAAHGDLLLVYDADGATPIEELEVLYQAMKADRADLVIGSRVVGGRTKQVSMSWHRLLIGRMYYFLTIPLLHGVRDAACGCKLFTSDCAVEVFSRLQTQRFAFDVEILHLAHVLGFRVVEVPVQWRSVPVSKVRLVRDGLEMFLSVLVLYYCFFVIARTRVVRPKDSCIHSEHIGSSKS